MNPGDRSGNGNCIESVNIAMRRILTILIAVLLCLGCEQMAPKPPPPSKGHLSVDDSVAGPEKIPELVQQAPPALPEPATVTAAAPPEAKPATPPQSFFSLIENRADGSSAVL